MSAAGGRWRDLLRRPAAAGLLAVAAALAAHGTILRNEFVSDDADIIVSNPDTRDLSQLGKVLLSPDSTKAVHPGVHAEEPYYRPLNRASYLIDYQLAGMSPAWFHAVNLALHALSVWLLFALGLRLFGATAPALGAALLLALHPIHCEAVAWASARNNLFVAVFSLGAFIVFIDAARRRSMLLATASALLFLFALGSKEPGAMLLPVLAAWLFLPGLPGASAGPRRAWLLFPHALALGAYLVLRNVALGGLLPFQSAHEGIGARLLANWHLLPRYLRVVAFPDLLTVFYDPPRFDFAWIIGWAIIGAAVFVFLRWRTVPGTVGLLWLAANWIPISGLVPTPSAEMAERFFHVPAIGVWLLAAEGARRLSLVLPRAPVAAGAAAILLALGVRAAVRDRDWRDDDTLFRTSVAAAPDSKLARFAFGVVLKDRGDLAGARREWEEALRLDPRDAGSMTQLGTAAATQGDLAGAERMYRDALAINPCLAEANLNLGHIFARRGLAGDARRSYQAVLGCEPPAAPEVAAQARARLAALGAVLGLAGQRPPP